MNNRTIIRFICVGALVVSIDYGSFYLLFAVLGLHLYLANSISFGLGLVASFMLNRLWTFSGGGYSKKAAHQFGFYTALALVNLLLTNLLIGWLQHVGMQPKIGKVLVIIVIAAWNFFWYKLFIFSHHDKSIGE